MNLSQLQIRALLADFYKECCLDSNYDMIEVARLFEYLADNFEHSNAYSIFYLLELDETIYHKPHYVSLLQHIENKYHETLVASIEEQLQFLCENGDAEEAFLFLKKEFLDSVIAWNSYVLNPILQKDFCFSLALKKEIDHFLRIDLATFQTDWTKAAFYLKDFIDDDYLGNEQKSKLYGLLSELSLFQFLPDEEEALILAEKSYSLSKNVRSTTALARYYLQKKDYKKARDFLIEAQNIDSNDTDVLSFMGDTYLGENKYDAALFWYQKIYEKNFYTDTSYSRKLNLIGEINSKNEKLTPEQYELNRDELEKQLLEITRFRKQCNLYATALRDVAFTYTIQKQFEKTEENLQMAIKACPQFCYPAIDLANAHIQAEKIDESVSTLLAAKNIYSNFLDFHFTLAVGYFHQKEFQKAVDQFEICRGISPKNDDVFLHEIGHMHTHLDQFDKAEECYLQAIEKKPENTVYLESLKNIIDDSPLNPRYYQFLQLRKEKEPANANLMNEIGVYLLDNYKTSEALPYIQNAIELNDKEHVFFGNLALAYERLNELDEAEQAYQKAIALKDLALYQNGLGIVFYRKNLFQEALRQFKIATEKEEDNPIYIENVGLAYQELGDESAAEEAYHLALQLSNTSQFANRLGIFYYQKKNYTQALDYYKQAIQLSPDDAVLYENLGLCYEDSGQWDEAKKAYETAAEISPNSTSYNRLGVFYFNRDQYEKALEFYLKALEFDAEDSVIYENIGLAYQSLGRLQEAEQNYNTAINKNGRAEANNLLGIMYYQNGYYQEALNQYFAAIQKAPQEANYYSNVALVYQETGEDELVELYEAKANELRH